MAAILPVWRVLLLLVLCALEGRLVFAQRAGSLAMLLLLLATAVAPAILAPAGATLAALALLVPMLAGLERSGLLPTADSLLLVTSAVLIVAGVRSLLSSRETRPAFALHAFPLTLLYTLASAIVISAGTLLWHQQRDSALFQQLREAATIPYSDRLYWLASTHLWLVGILMAGEWLLAFPRPEAWMRVAFWIYASTIVFFVLLQKIFILPETQLIWAEARMLTSPYEDIHSLGAVAISLFAGGLAVIRTPLAPATRVKVGIALLLLLGIAIATWSRATWLAGIAAITFVVFQGLSRRGRIVCALAGAVLLIAGNLAARTAAWQQHQYLWRLGSLIRFESPLAKDGARVNLYGKALRMIAERPLTGHGIGSFYLQSPRYATVGDPAGAQPNFAHNFLLQFAAELGVPLTLLLLLAVLWPFYVAGQATHISAPDAVVRRGLALALAVYLLTQLTANALNIYPSNQLYFWPLWAALITASRRKTA